ncbi:MAG TPA: hypothetical protein VHV26_02520, partial [Rhizomicrobium sp.]|nr:hypothetical protein [Rhizomicrobium sp.]
PAIHQDGELRMNQRRKVQMRRVGPRKSRVKLGKRTLLLFIILTIIAGYCGIVLNAELEGGQFPF